MIGELLAQAQSMGQNALTGIGNFLTGGPEMVGPPQQGEVGGVLANLQRPEVYMALLAAAEKFANPTSHSALGQVAQGMQTGLGTYQAAQAANEAKEYQRGREAAADSRAERTVGQGDRKLDLEGQQLEQQGRQFDTQIGLERDKLGQDNAQFNAQLENQSQQFKEKMATDWARIGLDATELDAKMKMWDKQKELYGAEAESLKAKAAAGKTDNLTGEERIINQFAAILKNNKVPEDLAYAQAFDMYKGAGGDKAKAVASYVDRMSFMNGSPEGRKLFQQGLEQLMALDYATAADTVSKAKEGSGQVKAAAPTPNESDVAIETVLKNNGITDWNSLPPAARQKVLRAVEQAFQAQGATFSPSQYR